MDLLGASRFKYFLVLYPARLVLQGFDEPPVPILRRYQNLTPRLLIQKYELNLGYTKAVLEIAATLPFMVANNDVCQCPGFS